MRCVSGSWSSPSALGRAGDVEVAEAHAAQAVRAAVPAERGLERPLLSPYGLIGRSGASSGIGSTSGHAVDRGARREDDAPDADRPGGLEQRDPAGDVVAVVPRRLDHRLADQRARRAVQDRLDPLVDQQPRDGVGVAVVPDVQPAPRRDRVAVTGREVIEDDDVVARGQERCRPTPSRHSRRRRSRGWSSWPTIRGHRRRSRSSTSAVRRSGARRRRGGGGRAGAGSAVTARIGDGSWGRRPGRGAGRVDAPPAPHRVLDRLAARPGPP